MNKKHTVFCLDGLDKGKEVELEENYSEEEEQLKKEKMSFVVGRIEYAGWCRSCGLPVRLEDATYFSNTNYYGKLTVDVLHRRCL